MFVSLGLDRCSDKLDLHTRVRAIMAAEGHRVLYDREVPFEIRNQTDPHDSAQEVICRALQNAPAVLAEQLSPVVLSGGHAGGHQGQNPDYGRGAKPAHAENRADERK
jgi:hypothetical protein